MKSLSLYYNTLRYLKIRQVLFRLFYLARNKTNFKKSTYKASWPEIKLKPVSLLPPVDRPKTYLGPGTFRFLSFTKSFNGIIDWNYPDYGKLWTYNLNYFDFLNQNEISREDGLELMVQFMASEGDLRDGKEPYPTSLRLVNWLKFVYRHNIRNHKINDFMLHDLHNLSRNIEYHLMANHLLENAVALTIGGYCLKQQAIYRKGMQLLTSELAEQICLDGGHYEKSPMYHQILLDRLLDVVNFLDAGDTIRSPATNMLSWLEAITFSDGSIPYFNDSMPGIAPSTAQLNNYARNLGIRPKKATPGDSGYRKLATDDFELIADGGSMGPAYQPGHGHNDAGSFILYVRGKPLITDTGTSTYEPCYRRSYERSVRSHNTTHPEDIEPSEIWGSFRVGRRETVEIINESFAGFEITRLLPTEPKHVFVRTFNCHDDSIEISDRTNAAGKCKSYIHFSPNAKIAQTDYGIRTPEADLFLYDVRKFSLEDCKIACGYNQLQSTKKLVIEYFEQMRYVIKIRDKSQH